MTPQNMIDIGIMCIAMFGTMIGFAMLMHKIESREKSKIHDKKWVKPIGKDYK